MGHRPGTNRRLVAVALTSDGRRVQVPVRSAGLVELSVVGLLRSLLVGVESLLGLLITGSRRENGGMRRDKRR